MWTALVMLTCVAALAAQESRSESRAASRPSADSRPGSLSDLVEAGREVLDILKGDHRRQMGWRLVKEGFELKKQGRLDEALKCFERLGTEFPDEYRTISWSLMVQVHESRGDIDAAIEVIERDLAREGSEDESPDFVYGELGRLLERRGDWAKALEAWKQATPREDKAQLQQELGQAFYQEFGIARCEFHLGQVESALKRLEVCLRKVRSLDGDESEAQLRPWEASPIAFAYAEYSGRSGRIPAARAFAATLPLSVQALVLDGIRIVEAWLTKDPAAVARVAAENKLDSFQLDGAGRLIGELGDAGIAFLARGIEAGDPNIVQMAGRSGRRELLPALGKRAIAKGQDAEAVTEAIEQIKFATTRPASRPAK